MPRNPSHRTYEQRYRSIARLYPVGDAPARKPSTAVLPAITEQEPDRLFIGIQATGIVYCDRTREVDGDYKRLANHYFTGEVKWHGRVPADLRQRIEADIARHPAGTTITVSGAGQTATFGNRADRITNAY